MTTERKAPEYIIISVSYWSGDTWRMEERGISTRKEAETKLQQFRDTDWDKNSGRNGYDARDGRKYQVMTASQMVKSFGKNWWDTGVYA